MDFLDFFFEKETPIWLRIKILKFTTSWKATTI